MFFGLDGLDTANKSGWHRAARQTTKEILVATQKFTGVIPPVVVPDTEDHQLDVASFERSINRMIDAGVDGLFFLGSSGEVVFSTDERRRQIIAEAVRIVDHRVPVLVGIIDTETERMIEHGKVAQELGADALVATCPFYALQGMTEVEEHFRILHEELDLPIFAYDIPVCVHTKLPWKLLAKLGAEGVLAGVKDSSGDDISFRYLGGADGSVPGLANVEPEGYVRQWKAAQAGDWATVKAEQDRLNEISHIWDVTSGVQGYAGGVGAFKTAMNLMGIFDSPTMPRPVKAMTGENVEAIRKVLQDNGLL